ncbi:N-acetylmuramoyl-L-alanine amidase [Paenibacillus sp. SYP-B4298]|uniref:N-acetylmuramoyl-L-alanine amidase n=1 Tax=Paenibacillus sp. SYP-B4298 TaxID=2996034 RepID=UPI0022DE4CA7|nr:N-acetylmuramoyl-L-alanine amidase [Paenibacillus sp. SYP-B4298]
MKIAIDAGHGPETAGKRSPDGSLREFHFNNPTAKMVAQLLAGYEGVETIFTHATDGSRDVPLKERTDKANAWGADVLISIHANASGDGWSSAEGIETFTYTAPSTASVKPAKAVQAALIAATGLRDRGVKQGNLHMVREARMPAILVECGFMTHRQEVELLKSDAYQLKCATAIVVGIAAVYGLRQKREEESNVEKKTAFKDVPSEHWAEDSIAVAVKSGLITGLSADTFGLGQPVTREQLCVILDRAGLLSK